jgi:hypothetical protein
MDCSGNKFHGALFSLERTYSSDSLNQGLLAESFHGWRDHSTCND